MGHLCPSCHLVVLQSVGPWFGIPEAGGRSSAALRLETVRHCPGRLRARSAAGGGRMPQRNFENQKALIDYAEQNGLVYV
jgi:hypothetical protein